MGLEDKLHARPAQLSGGEQQRVAIARAIVRRPDLLIADEPTGNIDDEIAMLLVRVFERINRLGTTVLIATHDVAFTRQFAHRRYHLDRGRATLADDVTVADEARLREEAVLADEIAAAEVPKFEARSPDDVPASDVR
jgi:cell division transport system ATP-binding protein